MELFIYYNGTENCYCVKLSQKFKTNQKQNILIEVITFESEPE